MQSKFKDTLIDPQHVQFRVAKPKRWMTKFEYRFGNSQDVKHILHFSCQKNERKKQYFAS